MKVYKDQTGRSVTLSSIPKRIISIVPSQTELLFDLGLNEEVIGITKFCIHPASWFYTKTRVGGTKSLHINIIKELEPDLIIANKEENIKEQVEDLAAHFPVWISDVHDLESAFEMIRNVGCLTDRDLQAASLIEKIKENFLQLSPLATMPLAAYLIWNDPYMTAGKDTFIHSMMEAAGLQNAFADHKRYPQTNLEQLKAKGLDLLLLSSEPFPFKQKHVDGLRSTVVNVASNKPQIELVDGQMFSWYGSHLQHAPAYFKKLYAKLFKSQ
jgi:ABC-type Fe3+-hydroxamate transport system substrate-binding protein